MGFNITNAPVQAGAGVDLAEGSGFLGQGLPSGVWNTLNLGLGVADKVVFIHAECNTVLGTTRAVGVRPIGGTGVAANNVRGGTTTGFLVKADSNGDIQTFNGGAGVAFFHMSTFI